jgi:hypothetical protein
VKRREPLPDLSHILEDSRPHLSAPWAEPAGLRPAPRTEPAGSPSLPLASHVDKRIHTRFDKVFLVVIGSELYGDSFAIARNLSAGGILVEMTYAPPLGTVVTVHFQYVHEGDQDDQGDRADRSARVDEIVARAEVKHHHYLNFTGSGEAASTRAIGMRFLEFVDLGGDGAGAQLDSQLVH